VLNLTFHGVGPPPRPLEQGERDVWLSHERFTAVLDAAAGRGDVRLTFDDGNASDLELALPALRERDLRATFFVSAELVGSAGYLDRGGIRELAAAGMTIGCHGLRHVPWRGLDDATLDDELVRGRRLTEQLSGRSVAAAACPFGAYDRRVLRRARSAGYARVFTSDGGRARERAWLQPRNTLRRDGDLERLLRTRREPERALRRAVKRWR
jgi:peptidoglycan/xylan/chitin deacetylase (PgdA/CDA1 family)